MKKNKIPYLILMIVHLGLFVVTIIKKKDKKPLLLYYSGIGMAYVFEYVVLNIFRGYRYYPKVLKRNRLDSVFGAIVSQALIVLVSAIFITFFQLGWGWKIFFTLLYSGIEQLFIHLKVFKNRWWKTIYTLISLPFYFWLVSKWSIYLDQKPKKWIGYLTLFFTFWVNYLNINFVLVAFLKRIIFKKGWSLRKYYVNFIIAPTYGFIQSIIGVIVTLKNKKLIGLGLLHLVDQLFYRLKLIKMKKWSVYCFLPIHIVLLLVGSIFKQQMLHLMSESECSQRETKKIQSPI
ncbi:hypothetical protein [Heyndrickxia sp. FSL W8-0423]|uniref:hypothetical protein n=1 Tax=Heyndrickxia sp. FSL W8-0423 TaxID=2921601 RepID=UPI0030F9B511